MSAVGSNKLEQAILQTVTYVDGFDFPLTSAEIHRYLAHENATQVEVSSTLDSSPFLARTLHREDGYFMLSERASLVGTRKQRLEVARQAWPQAVAFGSQMARLPFARMVAVTGSLAVDNVAEGFDIDFFIVTEDDSVWLCRAFAIALVRMAGLRGVDLCPNYFVGESALTFHERNMYTAHEVTQMVPLHGHRIYEELRRQNEWTCDFLPNAIGPPKPDGLAAVQAPQPGWFSRRMQLEAESLLRSPAGRWLEKWEMERKIRKLALQGQWNESLFTSSCCKGHFHDHQSEALDSYESRLLHDAT